MADMKRYRCPRCSQAGEWTDGTVKALGDERDEYWCQYCGEESPLEDCEAVRE
jgi:DNA-directed RNA polymerase subunit RPC12/RpoP